MRSSRLIGWVAAGLVVAGASACDDEENSPAGTAGSAGQAGSSGSGGSAGDGGSGGSTAGSGGSGMAGMGGMGNGGTGMGSGGAGVDAGVDAGYLDGGIDADSGVDSGLVTAFSCPTPAPTGANGQVFAIESVNLDNGDVVLRNISGAAQTITDAWRWCDRPGYGPMVTADTLVQPDATMSFSLASADIAGGELGIYIDGQYAVPASMRAYLSWGDGPDPAQGGREPTAVTAGWWVANERLTLEAGHVGFIATGTTDTAAGFTSVPAECF